MLITKDEINECKDCIEITIKDRYGKEKGVLKIDKGDLEEMIGRSIFLMSTGYVSIYPGNVGLHRLFMNAKKNEVVDHINGNRVDNRKSNLRIVDRSKNGVNRARHSNNKTGHRGVFYCKNIGKYNAYITINWKRKNLGYYKNIEDAINARLEDEKKYYGEYAPDDERYNKPKYKRSEKKYKSKV